MLRLQHDRGRAARVTTVDAAIRARPEGLELDPEFPPDQIPGQVLEIGMERLAKL